MVRTYTSMNATTSHIGELFDFVVKENEGGYGENTIQKKGITGINSRPVSDISYGAPLTVNTNSNSGIGRPISVPLEPSLSWRTQSMPKLHSIPLPKEETIYVEPMYGGNTRFQYEDYERKMRVQERQQRQLYMRDLQRQLEEQREQRLRTEIAFGGHEFEKELLKHQRQYGHHEPDVYNGSIQISDSTGGSSLLGSKPGPNNDYEKYLRSVTSLNQQQPQIQQYQPRPGVSRSGNRGYTPTFGTTSISNSVPLSASFVRREKSVPSGLNLFNNATTEFNAGITASPVTFVPDATYPRTNRPHNQRPWLEQSQNEVYDPWGKGGAGAPIRDRHGRLITDRRYLQKSWTTMLDTNLPHEFSPNASFSNSVSSAPNGVVNDNIPIGPICPIAPNQIRGVPSEQDLYKEELQKQIEEQKRLRELEKEKQRLEDERDRLRMEREMERQRREVDEERRRQQEKAEKGLKRAEVARGIHRSANGQKRTQPQPDDSLEWWERQPDTTQLVRPSSTNDINKKMIDPPPPSPAIGQETSDRRRSASIAIQDASYHRRSASIENKRKSEIQSISSGHRSRNQSAIERNEKILRQLSAMRERLNKEQLRVKSAMKRRDYSEELFEDEYENGPGTSNAGFSRPGSRPKNLATKGNLSGQSGGVQREKSRAFNIDNDDPPLVKLIKNSRTLDSATVRRPLPMSSSINQRNGIGSDEGSPETDRVPVNGISDHSSFQRVSRNGY